MPKLACVKADHARIRSKLVESEHDPDAQAPRKS